MDVKTTLLGNDSLAVLDQAVVSGSSFLTTILIGRWCGAEELGMYSLGLSLVVMWTCVQESLIALPFTVYRHRPLMGTQAEFAGGSLIHQAFLSALALITLAVVAAGLSWSGANPALASITLALAWVTPLMLLREFGRRFAFAHLRMAEALLLDVAVTVVQLAGLAWMAFTDTLSANNAYLAIGAACAVASAAWLYRTRLQFVIRWEQSRRALGPSWSLGKWLFASQLTLALQSYFVYWLLAWMLGVSATGVYAACLTVVLFANPLILGISNSLTPRNAHALSHGGSEALRRVVTRATLLLGAAMVLFCAVVFVVGGEVMNLLYDGSNYDGHKHTIVVLALAMLAFALGMPASNGLTALSRSDAVFKVGLYALALSVALTPFLVLAWGLTGAAYGYLAGNVVASVARWLAFLALVERSGPKADPMQLGSNALCNTRSSGFAQCMSAPHQGQTPTYQDAGQSCGHGRILLGVLETLEDAGIPYCLLHGYESYPQQIKSDVDCIISGELSPRQLAALLYENRERIGAEVVRWRNYYLVLAGKNADGSPCFLDLHLSVDYELGGQLFYAGREVLNSRRRHNQFWAPAVNLEFGCYLVKKIAKGNLDEEQGRRLAELYQLDPAGCQLQVARFWGARSTSLILSNTASGNWEPVKSCMAKLRAELRRWATLRHPLRMVGNWLRRSAGRIRQGLWPDGGLHIIFLGPDGAGKSTVLQAVEQQFGGVFVRTTCHSFPPELLRRLLRRPKNAGPDPLPHAGLPRSYFSSMRRAVCYWFVYYTFGYYVTVHLALARSTLVLHDRHLIDTLVDQRRYRYGGPLWLLRLIKRLIPKSDLVFLLDAPAEVVQARKQEVPFAESARQREAYLALAKTMRNAHVVDATQPIEKVRCDVNNVILRYLARRVARRFGLGGEPMQKGSNTNLAPVIDVMRQFTQSSDENIWEIEQHGDGAQARIFAVRRRDGRPIQQRYRELIVKLYKSDRQQSVELVRDQFESLSRLHAKVNDTIIKGWKIDSPVPLHQCEQPLALVMTMVPGKPLKSCLQATDQVTPETLESIADAVITAMEGFWLGAGGLYGEFNFDNILCDVAAGTLSFLDTSNLEKVFRCESVTRHCYPASRDLGYLLFDTETSIRTNLGNPGARRRQKYLAEGILRTFVKRIGPACSSQCLLDEIGACARSHLKRIRVSWSPRGIWRLFVRQTASRNIDKVLGRLRLDAVVPMAVSHAEWTAGSRDDG